MTDAAIKSLVEKWQENYEATIDETRRNLIFLEEYEGHLVEYAGRRYIFLEYAEDDGMMLQEENSTRQVYVAKWFIHKIKNLYEFKS